MVDGRPVPEDQPVEADHVKVLRLIKGGSGDDGPTSEAEVDALAAPQDEDEAGPVTALDRERRSLGVSELDFELPNAGAGPDPLSLSSFAATRPGRDDADEFVGREWVTGRPDENEAVVLLFLRDYWSRGCRQQVQDVADRYREFRERDAAAVAVLPEPEGKAGKWQWKYHLPFPLVADADKTVGEQYGQPTRFGPLGRRVDLLGRLPQVAILDARHGELGLDAVHRGDGPDDRPSVDDVLAMVDRLLGDDRE
ncbi:redoxin domain-containing protein [Halorussus sp. JP-T4]|nr:redoxin domain-containing protein [Halorussus sp. JP-T4]